MKEKDSKDIKIKRHVYVNQETWLETPSMCIKEIHITSYRLIPTIQKFSI